MATDVSGYFFNPAAVRPRKLGRKPRSMACLSVESAGENNSTGGKCKELSRGCQMDGEISVLGGWREYRRVGGVGGGV